MYEDQTDFLKHSEGPAEVLTVKKGNPSSLVMEIRYSNHGFYVETGPWYVIVRDITPLDLWGNHFSRHSYHEVITPLSMSYVRVLGRIIGPTPILHYKIALIAYILSFGTEGHPAVYEFIAECVLTLLCTDDIQVNGTIIARNII